MHLVNELAHQIKHAAQQQTEDYRPFVYGHISSYDPATHRVRLILPSLRDENNNAVLTGWMPLGTSAAGNNFGIQVAPLGGATPQNPTAGELCLIGFIERQQGVTAVASMVWNEVNQPPMPGLAPGEAVIQASTGSFVYLKKDNSINFDTSKNNGKVIVNAGSGEVDVNTTGKVSIGDSASEIDLNGTTVVVNGTLDVKGPTIFEGAVTGINGGPVPGSLLMAGDITAKAGAGSVTLSTHTHTQGVDSHGDTEAATNAPTGGT